MCVITNEFIIFIYYFYYRKCCVFLQITESLPAKLCSIHISVNMDSNPYPFLRPQTPPDPWEVPMLLLPSTLLSYPHQAMMSLAALWVTLINLERKKINNINFSFLSVVIIYSHFFKRQSTTDCVQWICASLWPREILGFLEKFLGGTYMPII